MTPAQTLALAAAVVNSRISMLKKHADYKNYAFYEFKAVA